MTRWTFRRNGKGKVLARGTEAELEAFKIKYADVIKEIVDRTNKECDRLMREEGLTEDEANKMIVRGNKEGLPRYVLGKRVR